MGEHHQPASTSHPAADEDRALPPSSNDGTEGLRRKQQRRRQAYMVACLSIVMLLLALLAVVVVPASAFLSAPGLQQQQRQQQQQHAARGRAQGLHRRLGTGPVLLEERPKTTLRAVSSNGEGAGDKTSLTTPVGGKAEAPAAGAETTLRYDRKHKGKEVVFQASKAAEWEVTEGPRSLKDYMALPPSQYSVLDADAIVRMTDDSFRCQIGGISFFGYQMTPVLYVKVIVDPVVGKSTLNIYKIELIGSRIAEIANGTFDVKARNVVAFRHTEAHTPERKVLMSTVSVHVDAQVPRGNVIPLHILEKGGSLAIKSILNVMVPRFVKILAKDYERWSRGDDSRDAVAADEEERLLNDAKR